MDTPLTAATVFAAWGRRLRRERLARHLSQAQVGATAGVDQATVSQIERGRVSFDSALSVARALDLDLYDLVAGMKPDVAAIEAEAGELAEAS